MNRRKPFGVQSGGVYSLLFGSGSASDLVFDTRDGPIIYGLNFNTIAGINWPDGRNMPENE